MAIIDYQEVLTLVRTLISETGREISFRKLASSTDVNMPWMRVSPGVESEVDVFATFVPPSGVGLGLDFISEDLLSKAEQVCLVAPHNSFDLLDCHQIVDGSQVWKITGTSVLKPGDIPLIFAFTLNR